MTSLSADFIRSPCPELPLACSVPLSVMAIFPGIRTIIHFTCVKSPHATSVKACSKLFAPNTENSCCPLARQTNSATKTSGACNRCKSQIVTSPKGEHAMSKSPNRVTCLKPCPRCGVPAGKYHDSGCTVERCPYCGGQLFFCLLAPCCSEAIG